MARRRAARRRAAVNSVCSSGRPEQAERLRDAEHFAEPLQRVLRAVGDLGAAEKAFEQPQPAIRRVGHRLTTASARSCSLPRRRAALTRGSSWHSACRLSRTPAAARNAAGSGATLELGSECGVFGKDFLIRLGLHRRPAHGRRRTHRLGVLQVRIDRRHHDARFNGDEVDADQRDAHPRVDDDSLVQHAIEDVNETCAACGSFNGHRFLLIGYFSAAADRRRVSDASLRSSTRISLPKLLVLGRQRLLPRRQVMIELPPVEADLLRFVDRANQQTNADRQQLDFGERHLDVARDDEPFVEHAIEDVDEPRGSSVPLSQWRRHSLGILWERPVGRALATAQRRTGQAYLSNADASS